MENCPQCSALLVHPREGESYCENCGFPNENRCEFSLVEIKAYLRSMFCKVSCSEDIRPENHRLACAYNLLLDESSGIAKFCDDGKADNLSLDSFSHVRI